MCTGKNLWEGSDICKIKHYPQKGNTFYNRCHNIYWSIQSKIPPNDCIL